MLYHVRMDVHPPTQLPPAEFDRLKAEADRAGFRFDRHAARNELQAATFGRRRRGKARLLLSPSGAMAIELKSCG